MLPTNPGVSDSLVEIFLLSKILIPIKGFRPSVAGAQWREK
jgi:hypothetical protein